MKQVSLFIVVLLFAILGALGGYLYGHRNAKSEDELSRKSLIYQMASNMIVIRLMFSDVDKEKKILAARSRVNEMVTRMTKYIEDNPNELDDVKMELKMSVLAMDEQLALEMDDEAMDKMKRYETAVGKIK